MPRFGTCLSIALLLVQPCSHAGDPCTLVATAADTTVLQRVCQALAAVNSRDAATLRALMAEDFALTSVSGKYFAASKSEMIGRWTQPATPGTASSSRLTKVFRAYQAGAFGFVVGEIQDREQEGQTASCTAHAFTDVWELRGPHWKWVQSHESGYRAAVCAE